MKDKICFLNMFPDFEPPEEIALALSQAAIVAADIDTLERRVEVAIHSEEYIPRRMLERASREICRVYGLRTLLLTATHPESELQKIEL